MIAYHCGFSKLCHAKIILMDGSIYTHISRNKFQTVFIMTAFIIIVSFLGWFFGEFFAGDGLAFVGFALIFSGFTSFVSYYNSDRIVLSLVGATEVSKDVSPDLHNLVENMSIASGIPKPRIYITEDESMNAFATGRDPEHAAICFTRGILTGLEKRELEGVVAHEMSHIGNYDIRLMSIVSILVGTIALLSDWFTRGVFRGDDRDRGSRNGVLMLIGILLLVLSPLIATLIKLAVSRNREFLADSTAALITRYPDGLANALRKLSADSHVMRSANAATAHMFITNPFKGKNISYLFSTHPPVEERIRRLESM